MITKIQLNDVATFTESTELDNLKQINFFYGSNGSGKTTISKLIASQDSYPNCLIEWQANNRLKTIVYNEDFVREYYYQSPAFKGIFTLGEGAKEIEEQIVIKKKEKDELSNNIIGLTKTKADKETEAANYLSTFQENCWKNIFEKYKNDFDNIFTGYRKSKPKFASQIIKESNKNISMLKSSDELKEKYNLLFNEELKPLTELNIFSSESVDKLTQIEQDRILQTKIIGKEDVDIAKMIHKLQNHDWVSQGKNYLYINYDEESKSYICPFCQQPTPETFKKQLEEYFDETYESQIKLLKNLSKEYEDATSKIDIFLNGLESIADNKYFEEKKSVFKDKKTVIDQTILHNKTVIQNKEDNPSTLAELKSITETIEELNQIIVEINAKIKQHNSFISNKENEKTLFVSEIWKFFCNDVAASISTYNQNKQNVDRAIVNISQQKDSKEENIKTLSKEISELEKQIKSVKPTVEAINQLLQNFGFRGFKLRATEDEKHYEIIREDNTPAKETLSEGERNFIMFLYFYHYLQGVLNPAESITENKIVVFDDPVSSMDSEVLFIVSTLIRNILLNITKNEGNIKQIFILTHNAYFFKEVTFTGSGDHKNKRNDRKYYVVRKVNNVSKINPYDINPIKSTYQLLWDELKREPNDCINLQNAMRRIIEFYFNTLANINEENLPDKFQDQNEKTICRSLIAWMNIGSHEIFDDINYSFLEANIEKYKEVFKKIFEATNHLAHYNMMMNIN